MGLGLAHNLSKNNAIVTGWDISDQVLNGINRATKDSFLIVNTMLELIDAVRSPRTILLSIPSGDQVDKIINQLISVLTSNDVVVDCGNSHFCDTIRREEMLKTKKIGYLGIGFSGGPVGARNGPAIMAGGNFESWQSHRYIFELISAKKEGDPCCDYFGSGGAGHFVKMVHNSIEYAIMHLLLESYAFLDRCFRFSRGQIKEIFNELDSGNSGGYLTNITMQIVDSKMTDKSDYLIDVVNPVVGQKGTGKWAIQIALDLDVSVPTLVEAVMLRTLSKNNKLNDSSSVSLKNENFKKSNKVKFEVIDTLSGALSIGFASIFEQGLTLLDASKPALGFSINRKMAISTWRNGSILQGGMVESIFSIMNSSKNNNKSIMSQIISNLSCDGTTPLKRLVSEATLAGVPCSGFSSSLAYVESLRGNSLPTELIQMQRDFFGNHGLLHKETGVPVYAPWNTDNST
jgi:6-phosphogluconate dehydrogenase